MNKNKVFKNLAGMPHASMKPGFMSSKIAPHAGKLKCQHGCATWADPHILRIKPIFHASMLACWQIFGKNGFYWGGIYSLPTKKGGLPAC